ncbi:Ig-like domain-containing protein, partial [Acinetobacter rongchengensis]
MTRIVIVAKNGGDLLQDTQASEVVLSQPSVVQIGVTKDAVESITREGNNVVIVLKNGEKIVVDNFFNDANNADNSLVFPEQDKGFALVQFDSTNGAVNYLGLDNLEPLLYTSDNAGLIAWLFPVVTAGGILWWAHRDHDSKDQTSPNAKATLTSITDDTGLSSTDLITNDQTLILNGKITEPLAADETVQISLDGGKTWLDAVVDRNNGSWSYDNTNNPLADGVYAVQVRTVDEAGNVGPITEQKITIDTTIPEQLEGVGATDNVGPNVGDIPSGGTTDDNTPTITGTGEPGATVEVIDNGKPLGTVTVDSAGNWTFTPETPLTDGPHEITTTQTDPAGNTSDPSDPLVLTVDTTPPAKPEGVGATDNVGPNVGNIPSGGTTDDNTPTITGTGEPGATVEVSDNGKPLGTATVDSTGNWTFTPETPLTDGPHEITTTQTDPAGNTSEPSDPLVLTVDTTPPAKPEGVGATDNVGPNVGDIPSGGTTDDNTPTITGTGEPGATVEVSDNGKPLGTATVDSTGNWTFTPETPLTDGPHEITTTQTDPAGNTSEPSDPLVLTVDTTPPAKPEGVGATDNVGPNVGDIPSGGTTDDNTPTITGTGEPGATVEVSDNGKPLGTATVDSTGNWTFTPETPLTDGPHEITTTQTDPAGNTSEPSDPLVLTVDTTA